MHRLGRCVGYLIASVVGAGVLAEILMLPTYGGHEFGHRFAIYTLPLPFSLGMLHLPAQVAGLLLCVLATPRSARTLRPCLLGASALALIGHLLAALADWSDQSLVLMYGSLDLWLVTAIYLRVSMGSIPSASAADTHSDAPR